MALGWAALVHLVSDRMESVMLTPGVQIPNAPGDSAWRWNVGNERICASHWHGSMYNMGAGV